LSRRGWGPPTEAALLPGNEPNARRDYGSQGYRYCERKRDELAHSQIDTVQFLSAPLPHCTVNEPEARG
jgi:hypothetical protein